MEESLLASKVVGFKRNTPPWVFSSFSNRTNDTKSHKTSHMMKIDYK